MRQVVNVMNIVLMTVSNDQRKAVKAYTTVDTVDAVPTDNMSILQPVVNIKYDDKFLAANYMYIAKFGRYYKITGRDITIGKRIIITGFVDAVMSWYDNIKNCSITVTRNGGIGAPTMIPDDKLPVIPNKENVVTTIASNPRFNTLPGLSYNNYVITTVNGGVVST